MGTRWRGLLAPIDSPTGDGRRFLEMTNDVLPLPFRWQPADTQGHDDAVIVGMIDNIGYMSVAEAIAGGWISQDSADAANLDPAMRAAFGQGEFFDDADPQMTRLAQNVAEAKLLASKGVVGPSVGPGSYEFYGFVHPGTKDLITEQDVIRAMDSGEPLDGEALFSTYEIAEGTLVPVPAFGSETRTPFEVLTPADQPGMAAASGDSQARRALVAAANLATVAPPADLFEVPDDLPYQRLTLTQRADGYTQVLGYLAAFETCHVGFRDGCHTAPPSLADYLPFNRFPVDVTGPDGQVTSITAGRLTSGLGRVGSGCQCCPNNDDHACRQLGLGATLAHYDRLNTLARVRAVELPGRGIVLAGYVRPDLTSAERQVLQRRRWSGDWRDLGGNLELVEALALAKETEGFPIPVRSGFTAGRQTSLTAAGRAPIDRADPPVSMAELSSAIGRVVTDAGEQLSRMFAGFRTAFPPFSLPPVPPLSPTITVGGVPVVLSLPGVPAPTTTTAAAASPSDTAPADTPPPADGAGPAPEEQTGAMIALRMSEADAARLAVDGGEPADGLHMTVLYLGEAADFSEEQQQAIIQAIQQAPPPMVEGRGFALSAFNPDDPESTALVLGVSGDGLVPAAQMLCDAVASAGCMWPDQYSPWAPHITLAYSPDVTQLAELADRVGPIMFDRARVAFAGQATDIPLTPPDQMPEQMPMGEGMDMAVLLDEVDAAMALLGAPQRAREAGALAAEIDALEVV